MASLTNGGGAVMPNAERRSALGEDDPLVKACNLRLERENQWTLGLSMQSLPFSVPYLGRLGFGAGIHPGRGIAHMPHPGIAG